MEHPATPELSVSHQTQTYNDKYVIVYNYKDVDSDVANNEITLLTQDLESTGLQTEVRAGRDQTLLVFVKAPRNILGSYVYNSRLKDWLYGIVQSHPGGVKNAIVDGAFEAEDILSVYHLVNWPKTNGGAGITPGWGQWENVESIFPLHNEATNLALLGQLSSRLFLTSNDLDQIRNLFGTKVAFYFAFIQTYVVFLTFPAITGLLAWQFLPGYSLLYAVGTTVWCTVFLEHWKIRQTDLSIRWDVQGVGAVKITRPQFRWEKITVDSTGRSKHYYPKRKQVLRQLLQIPFMAVATLALGVIILAVFALETLISEGYHGPYKNVIEYVPTILLGVALPQINGYLESIATFITDFENHRTADTYDMSRTQKVFVLQIITNYLPIFITAFLYVPFGHQIIPRLESAATKLAGPSVSRYLGKAEPHHVDGGRLRTEIIALTVTGQLSSFFEENLQPILKRKFLEWYRDYRANRAEASNLSSVAHDYPDEIELLQSVRRQASLEPYNVQDDIAEIVLQFGFLALFSPVWPLISIGFLINNVIELRTDYFKLIHEHQRPAPVRTDGIGPWIASLDFLTWAGSISTGAIVHLYGGGHTTTTTTTTTTTIIGGGAWWALPITIFVSEHVFLALRALVRFVLGRVGSEHIRKQRSERYLSRVRHLEEMEANRHAHLVATPAERARTRSMRAAGEDAFFARQVEEGASAQAAVGLMHAFWRAKEAGAAAGQQPKLD